MLQSLCQIFMGISNKTGQREFTNNFIKLVTLYNIKKNAKDIFTHRNNKLSRQLSNTTGKFQTKTSITTSNLHLFPLSLKSHTVLQFA